MIKKKLILLIACLVLLLVGCKNISNDATTGITENSTEGTFVENVVDNATEPIEKPYLNNQFEFSQRPLYTESNTFLIPEQYSIAYSVVKALPNIKFISLKDYAYYADTGDIFKFHNGEFEFNVEADIYSDEVQSWNIVRSDYFFNLIKYKQDEIRALASKYDLSVCLDCDIHYFNHDGGVVKFNENSLILIYFDTYKDVNAAYRFLDELFTMVSPYFKSARSEPDLHEVQIATFYKFDVQCDEYLPINTNGNAIYKPFKVDLSNKSIDLTDQRIWCNYIYLNLWADGKIGVQEKIDGCNYLVDIASKYDSVDRYVKDYDYLPPMGSLVLNGEQIQFSEYPVFYYHPIEQQYYMQLSLFYDDEELETAKQEDYYGYCVSRGLEYFLETIHGDVNYRHVQQDDSSASGVIEYQIGSDLYRIEYSYLNNSRLSSIVFTKNGIDLNIGSYDGIIPDNYFSCLVRYITVTDLASLAGMEVSHEIPLVLEFKNKK